ncbi:hypothetical protein PENTCL1PPCAC_4575, partial [Pristionchus entomophagus]
LTKSKYIFLFTMQFMLFAVPGEADDVWVKAGKKLMSEREKIQLPLQECSIQMTPSFAIAHVVTPKVSSLVSLTADEIEKIKNCYDALLSKARDSKIPKMVFKVAVCDHDNISALRAADLVDIAFQSVFEAIRNGEMEVME